MGVCALALCFSLFLVFFFGWGEGEGIGEEYANGHDSDILLELVKACTHVAFCMAFIALAPVLKAATVSVVAFAPSSIIIWKHMETEHFHAMKHSLVHHTEVANVVKEQKHKMPICNISTLKRCKRSWQEIDYRN